MTLEFIDWLQVSVVGMGFLSNSWLAALLILVATGILAWLLLLMFSKVFEKLAAKTKTDVDDVLFEKTRSPLFWLILVQGLRLSVIHLGLEGISTQIVGSLSAIAFVYLMLRVVDVFLYGWGSVVSKRAKSNLDDVLLPLIHKFSVVIFWIIGILWVMSIWEIDITPYLAGAGIAGIVLGMALQDSLKNILGGVSLLIDGAIKIGDKIRLDSGEVGEVLDISLRSTKVRTYDNEVITVPNGYLANSNVHNYTKPNAKVRVYVPFGVEYGVKVEKVQKVVLGALSTMDGLLEDPAPAAVFLNMGDSALDFKAFFWVGSWKDSHAKKVEATKLIYDALNKAKIGIPYPTRTVHLIKSK